MIHSQVSKTRCFVGTEAEGPHRGERVLFVPGCVSSGEYLNAYRKLDGIDRVYYGAGNNRIVGQATLEAIVNSIHQSRIDLEVDYIPAWLTSPMFESVTRIGLSPKEFMRLSFLKVYKDDLIIWIGKTRDAVYITKIDDPLFAEDKNVE